MIYREEYLAKIRPFYDSNLIKVIIGIRRCGKSTLLKQIYKELIDKHIDKQHIIFLNLEDYENSKLRDTDTFYKYLSNLFKDKNKYYLLCDEIQWVNEWERVINSFRSTHNVSIFLSGSNSRLLSSELATLLTGRYVSFKIYPFSFKEVVEYKNISLSHKDKVNDCFNDYLIWGGMPQRFELNDIESTKTYLNDLLNNIFLVDIAQRFRMSDITLLEKLIEYFVTNPSQVFSAKNITNYFKSENIDVSIKTIYKCIGYLHSSCLMSNCPMYDVRGKRLLLRKDKHYLTDLGLGQILNTNKKLQKGSYLENIVYNQLLLKGYDVSTYKTSSSEIDFIAKKDNETEYYQVCWTLDDGSGKGNQEIIDREFKPLLSLNDNYDKYVLSMDNIDFSQKGIKHINAIDWLIKQ